MTDAYELLSRLLGYPDASILGVRPELLPRGPARRALERFAASLDGVDLGTLQREYVDTFDFDRRASLHLTFHLYGDRRRRGIELVRLKRRYAEAGLALDDGELPDALPVVLEFAALAPEAGAAVLAGLLEPIELVRTRLTERGSRYAHLLDAVAATLPRPTRRQAERVRRLAAEEPPAELVGLEPARPVPELEGLSA
ncbi:MAG TPA: nitrate reductase molybdenum cofactor assembly chaperone [Gaiellaceae bacterium]|nr:nitrate reductase molybdenum cofactor assembly chaperone [Gaiellaceae bacterium]